MVFVHRHKKNEETCLFLGVSGEMTIEGERFKVGKGTSVWMQLEARRVWWNTGMRPYIRWGY